jgi:hypothetical protein
VLNSTCSAISVRVRVGLFSDNDEWLNASARLLSVSIRATDWDEGGFRRNAIGSPVLDGVLDSINIRALAAGATNEKGRLRAPSELRLTLPGSGRNE